MRVGGSAWHLFVMPGCCLDLQCSSEGPYVCVEGGRGRWLFSDLAAVLLPTTTIVRGMTAVSTVLDLPILIECIVPLELVRRLKLLRVCLQWTSPCISFIYTEDNEYQLTVTGTIDQLNTYPATVVFTERRGKCNNAHF